MSRKSLRRLIYECENLPDHGITDEEVGRYAQQMMVGPGVSGQKRIKEAKVLVVGVGAEGSAVLVQLSAAGVGELGLVDPASISESDPAKEPVFAGAKMGAGKAESAKAMITDLNSLVTVNLYPMSINDLDHATVIPKYNVIVCCTDTAPSRYYLNDLAVRYQKPMVLACASRTEGHCLVVNRANGPCFRCLLPTPTGISYPDKFQSPQSDVGVYPTLKGTIGGIAAVETLKIILGLPGLDSEVLIYEAVQASITKHKTRTKRLDCPACGSGGGIDITSYDYSVFSGNKPSKTHLELLSEIPEVNKIEPGAYFKVKTTQEWEGKPHFILDVRSSIQFSIYHLPNAVNVPLPILSNYLVYSIQDDLAKVAETDQIVVICRRGVAATQASHLLLKQGITRISQIDFLLIVGGLNACAHANSKVPFY